MRLLLNPPKLIALLLTSLLLITSIGLITHTRAEDLTNIIDSMGPDMPLNMDKQGFRSIETLAASIGCAGMGCATSDGEVINQGAIQFTREAIAYMVTEPPILAGHWVQDTIQNIDPVSEAYAQTGLGFASLSPVLDIWKAFRNLAYVIYIVIFVVIGFMIMFRAQINPQTVVTIQSALPQLIITLILITFSYAIAGFVVDLMFLSILVMTGLFQSAGVLSDAALTNNVIFDRNILAIIFKYFGGVTDVAGSSAGDIGDVFEAVVFDAGWFGDIVNGIVSVLAFAIIAIAIVIAAFRTLFALLQAYVSIILQVIFAPLLLLFNALPGQNAFTGWLKKLAVNALIFPAVVGLLIIAAALGGSARENSNIYTEFGISEDFNRENTWQTTGEGFVPPLLAGRGANNVGANSIRSIIALGMIMLLPNIADIIRKTFGAEDQLGGLALQNLGRGIAPAKSLTKPFGFAGSYIKQSALQSAFNEAAVRGARDEGMFSMARGAVRGGLKGISPSGITKTMKESHELQQAQKRFYVGDDQSSQGGSQNGSGDKEKASPQSTISSSGKTKVAR